MNFEEKHIGKILIVLKSNYTDNHDLNIPYLIIKKGSFIGYMGKDNYLVDYMAKSEEYTILDRCKLIDSFFGVKDV